MHYKGHILKMTDGGKRAEVEALAGRVFKDLLVLQNYGDASNIEPDDTSQCAIFLPMNEESNACCIPYNVPLQPSLEPTEKAVGNFKKGNMVTFKANGDVEVTGAKDFLATALGNLNITASAKITLNAPDVSLGDATGFVLNDAAIITDSVGGACTIATAGQDKVKA